MTKQERKEYWERVASAVGAELLSTYRRGTNPEYATLRREGELEASAVDLWLGDAILELAERANQQSATTRTVPADAYEELRREVTRLAQESVQRELKLAKLEAEVEARRQAYMEEQIEQAKERFKIGGRGITRFRPPSGPPPPPPTPPPGWANIVRVEPPKEVPPPPTEPPPKK